MHGRSRHVGPTPRSSPRKVTLNGQKSAYWVSLAAGFFNRLRRGRKSSVGRIGVLLSSSASRSPLNERRLRITD